MPPFCGATGALRFRLWLTLPMGFKARVYAHHLHSMSLVHNGSSESTLARPKPEPPTSRMTSERAMPLRAALLWCCYAGTNISFIFDRWWCVLGGSATKETNGSRSTGSHQLIRADRNNRLCSHKSTTWRLVKYWCQSLENNTHKLGIFVKPLYGEKSMRSDM